MNPQNGRSGGPPPPGWYGPPGSYQPWPSPPPGRPPGRAAPAGLARIVAAALAGLASQAAFLLGGVGLVVATGGAIVPAIVAAALFGLVVKPRHPAGPRPRAKPGPTRRRHAAVPRFKSK